MTALQEYIEDAANLVVAELPLQTLDSAIALVYAYISNNGGWIPNDPLVPLGEGHLVSNFTVQQSADAVRDEEINSVYNVEFTVTTSIKVNVVAKLSQGLSISSAAASMTNQVANFITRNINQSRLPMAVTATSTQTTNTGNSLAGGYTTQAIRQSIASEVADFGTTKIVDLKAIALLYVTNTYGVDNTWNLESIYIEPDNPVVVQIKKYTTTSYATLDGTSTRIYVISVSPTTYEVVTGVIIN